MKLIPRCREQALRDGGTEDNEGRNSAPAENQILPDPLGEALSRMADERVRSSN